MRNFFIILICIFSSNPVANAIEGKAEIHGISDEVAPISGEAHFKEVSDGIEVTVDVTRVWPEGKHGVAIHELGACFDGAKAAGELFHPVFKIASQTNPSALGILSGNLGNIEVDKEGTGTLKGVLSGFKLFDLETGIIGRSVIIYEKAYEVNKGEQDLGGRIGCGVIGLINTENLNEGASSQEKVESQSNSEIPSTLKKL